MTGDARTLAFPRLYIAEPMGPERVGRTMSLPDEPAHHAVRVLRLAPGDRATLFDGRGGEYAATLTQVGKRGAEVSVDAFLTVERESPLTVVLVQCVLASDAMDYAVRKATELGVAVVSPVVAERSQRIGDDRSDKRLAHWRRIAIAACEQCGRNRLPAIEPIRSLDDWLRALRPEAGIAAAARQDAKNSLASLIPGRVPRFVVVGPEGGFTDAELQRADAAGVLATHLGPRTLRAETAGIAALAMLQALAGDAR
jgi:16S rRNA (uracil1498-N3)-methyltransferase